MAKYDFDLLIAGAGPAGCTLALNLAPKGYRIGILDKETFPRHKICGDALSGKVIRVMKRIPGNVYTDFLAHVKKVPSWGIRFTAPNHHWVDIPFLPGKEENREAPGFVCNRSEFDHFMFMKLKGYPNITVFEGEKLAQVAVHPEFVIASTGSHEFQAKMIAGADGVHSTVRKYLSGNDAGKKHYCTGIRGYFENVTGLHAENFIELVFLRRLLPGYFWIFPSTGGLVNAGFGMMQNMISRRRENMSHVFNDLISTDPLLADRFSNSKLVGKLEAHTLPLGTFRLNRSGSRFLLLGDAAFLVDPFSGEGIGNAMASGEIAAQVMEASLTGNDFSAEAMHTYDLRIMKRFSQEFRTMAIMQMLAGSAGLFNLVVDKARKNDEVRELLTAMYTSEDVRKRLTRPAFYIKLLVK